MKLTYLPLRGRAEAIRFLFAASGEEFEDNRVSMAVWKDLKDKTPWGFVPLLETDDGVVIAESTAINRFLARKFNMCGATDVDSAKCDEYVDAFLFIIKREWIGFIWEETDTVKKEEKKQCFINTTCPNYLKKLNAVIEANGGTYLVGNSLTWADVFIAQGFENVELITGNPDLVKPYPAVARMKNAVLTNPGIQAWIQRRPDEDFLALVRTWEHKSK